MKSAALAIRAQKNIESNNVDRALSFSGQAVSQDKKNIFSWSMRYQAREKEGRMDKARQGLEAAVKNSLAHKSMYIILAKYYLQSKQGADAERILLQGQARLGPKRKFYVPLIHSALEQGDMAKAQQYKKQCLSFGKNIWKKIIGGVSD